MISGTKSIQMPVTSGVSQSLIVAPVFNIFTDLGQFIGVHPQHLQLAVLPFKSILTDPSQDWEDSQKNEQGEMQSPVPRKEQHMNQYALQENQLESLFAEHL